jgi:hypothetical protein
MTERKSTAKVPNDKPVRAREKVAACPGAVAGQCHPSPFTTNNGLAAPAGVCLPIKTDAGCNLVTPKIFNSRSD